MRAIALVVALLASPVYGQAAKDPDPKIAALDYRQIEQRGACYLEDFNLGNRTSFTAEGLFQTLRALPRDHPFRNEIKYDFLLSAVDLAIGKTCDRVPPPPPVDIRLSQIAHHGDPCSLNDGLGIDGLREMQNVLRATSDASLRNASLNRNALERLLQQSLVVNCDPVRDETDPDPVPTPVPPKPKVPKAPTPVPTKHWREYPVGDPLTRSDLFDIALQELLIPDRYILFYDDRAVEQVSDMTVAQSLVQTLDFPAAAMIEDMPRLGAMVLALAPEDLDQALEHPAILGLAQDRLGFFNAPMQANTLSQDVVDRRVGGPDDQFSPLQETLKTRVYVVDGGIRADHDEVTGKVVHWRAIGNKHGGLLRHACADHGTAVASLIAGHGLGIAQNVDLIDVDVTPCDAALKNSFPASHILMALDWISQTERFLPRRETHTLINMSLGVPAGNPDSYLREGGRRDVIGLEAFEAVVRKFLQRNDHITIVAAAGNESANACHFFPAGMAEVVTVGGTTAQDTLWDGSNYGPCVDTFAPAQDILAAVAGASTSDKVRLDGTSFATATATGVIAHRLAAGQDIARIKSDILRPVTTTRSTQATLARGNIPEDGAMLGNLKFLAKIPDAFRGDCEVQSYDGTLNMRAGPGVGFGRKRTLVNGDAFQVLDTRGRWLQIALEDGTSGWVASSDKRARLVRSITTSGMCSE